MKTKLLFVLLFTLIANWLFAQKTRQPCQNGDIRLDIKLPYFNYLALNPNSELVDAEFGFSGYGLGLEYNYNDKKFIEASSSFAMTFEYPLPVPIDDEYNKILSSFYFNLTDNYIRKKFYLDME